MRHCESLASVPLLLLLTGCAAFHAPRLPPVIAEPAFLQRYAETHRFSLGHPRSIKIAPDGGTVLFLRSPADSPVQDLYAIDTDNGRERLLLTADQILQGAREHLSIEERARRERMRLSARGIASYSLSDDGRRVLVPLTGRLFVIDLDDGRVTELESDHGYPTDARFSPNGRFVSCVRNSELYVLEISTGIERQLTAGAGGNITNARAEFIAQEEMGRRTGYWWSPDAKTIAYQQTDTTGVERMHIMDPTHPDRPPRDWPYPRPGKKNADVRLGLIPVQGGDTVWVAWAAGSFPYLATVKWEKNAPLTILVQNREQTSESLLAVDLATGNTTTLLTEQDDAWINLDQRMPHWFPDGSAFLWTTERNGASQLEMHGRDGRLIAPLTTTDFGFRKFVHLDEIQRVVYVLASDDPTQTHVYRIPLDGAPRAAGFIPRGTPTRLTHAPGQHGMSFAENHTVYIHTAATLDGRKSRFIHRSDAPRAAGFIPRGNPIRAVGDDPPFTPNLELTIVGDDPQFHAVLIRPRNFDPRYRYPVIVYVYAGPHGQMVQASPRRYVLQQWIADHGFIVVAIDGRGTPHRGREWERIIKGNLIDVPLQDQVAALHGLGEMYPELDLGRVGIYGWSFGGYFSAMAAMRRPDVYHAAVAGAPVADWLDYDTHYTERYMGLPEDNPGGYERSSVLTYCQDLSVPLLIIHGTADDNVYFLHSLKISDALFRAGKHHELLVLTDFTHMVRDPLVTTRLYTRIVDFFRHHLSIARAPVSHSGYSLISPDDFGPAPTHGESDTYGASKR